jgi:hypothetical protein
MGTPGIARPGRPVQREVDGGPPRCLRDDDPWIAYNHGRHWNRLRRSDRNAEGGVWDGPVGNFRNRRHDGRFWYEALSPLRRNSKGAEMSPRPFYWLLAAATTADCLEAFITSEVFLSRIFS